MDRKNYVLGYVFCRQGKRASKKDFYVGGAATRREGFCKACLVCSGQVMFDGKAGSGATRGDPELIVDRGQVSRDGAWTDNELLGHLHVGESLGHQPQHLHFSGSEAGWIGG